MNHETSLILFIAFNSQGKEETSSECRGDDEFQLNLQLKLSPQKTGSFLLKLGYNISMQFLSLLWIGSGFKLLA